MRLIPKVITKDLWYKGAGRRVMLNQANHDPPEKFGFLLVPDFSMIGFSSAVEPLRVANRLCGRPLFSWHIFSVDGAPVQASNGMAIVADAPVSAIAFLAVPAAALAAAGDYDGRFLGLAFPGRAPHGRTISKEGPDTNEGPSRRGGREFSFPTLSNVYSARLP